MVGLGFLMQHKIRRVDLNLPGPFHPTAWLWLLGETDPPPLPLAPQNLKRVAEVWMDEYAEYIYQRRPEYRHLSAGDVAAQKKLRSSLNCKSFKWFMTKIAWDLPKFYPPVEPPAAAWGEVSLESRACSIICWVCKMQMQTPCSKGRKLVQGGKARI